MTMMTALQVQALGDNLGGVALVEQVIPVPVRGQVLVRIEAAALGFPDLLMTRGQYQAKPPLPFVPGMEGAGFVVAAPGCSRVREGDRVIVGGLTGIVAQYGVFPEASVLPLPESLDMAEGASLRAAYLTAWVALVCRGQARPGDWLLVHGAAGGVGLAAVDLGVTLGLNVIAVASTAAKRGAISGLYETAQVIDGSAGFREQVLALTGGCGADLVFDPVGGDVFDESTRCIAFDGRLLVVGFAAGRIPQIGANIPLIKGFSVVGVRAGEYGRRFPDRGAENIANVLRLAKEGQIRPHVHARYPMADWAQAYRAMEQRDVIGRSVILPHEG
ncbi:MAG: NADPH:quinone oxidoreductase [Novosphingobium sp. 17-62-19]|uniref:NADPH:quinone oxidoreductase family protein n=1 Tax=Novosphingobium sp. 17-62-19 TaxID=1970406 RepID=UPI000BC4B142|nr:MAG: NADPH:quinone oxidoreductase [Novosphingobium sp. 17-62-19]